MGTLVAIDTARDGSLCFAEVVTRRVEHLALDRGTIGVKLCHKGDLLPLIKELANAPRGKERDRGGRARVGRKPGGKQRKPANAAAAAGAAAQERGAAVDANAKAVGTKEADGADEDEPGDVEGVGACILQISSDFFVTAPVLRRLQDITQPPFAAQLFHDAPPEPLAAPRWELDGTTAPYVQGQLDAFDPAQRDAFTAALRQNVTLVQGPPGTGKTRIGVALARALLAAQDAQLLVICYKNHALDQFLEDILDSGIPDGRMVRLGGRSKSERIAALDLFAPGQVAQRRLMGEGGMDRAQKHRNYLLRIEVRSNLPRLAVLSIHAAA